MEMMAQCGLPGLFYDGVILSEAFFQAARRTSLRKGYS